MNGNYIPSSEISTHPFRGAVQSGGGSGMIITTQNGEAVVLTVAHGYNLKYTKPESTSWMALMDYKKNDDGGLANAYGSTSTSQYATSDRQNIIGTNLGLWRHFTFGDSESCPMMNSGEAAARTGALDDPYACDGLGPDIDLAMQRIKLTTAVSGSRQFPEIGLHLEPLKVGQEVFLAGFGRQYPCEWNGITNSDKQSFPEGLKTAKSVIKANFYSEVSIFIGCGP